jgi:dihydrofolate reductase
MRKVIHSLSLTLDGFYAGPNGELDWVIADEFLHEYSTDLIKKSDTIIFGRVMYQLLEEHWPTAESIPTLAPSELAFAKAINAIPKIVVSRTLDNATWNNTKVERGDIVDLVSTMKQQPGKDLMIGGGSGIVATLAQNRLVDEYHFTVNPIALGRGKAFFGELREELRLKHLSTTVLDSGVVLQKYGPA